MGWAFSEGVLSSATLRWSTVTDSVGEAWEEAALHPDPAEDLGYRSRSLMVIHVEQGGEKFMFLPDEEEHLHDDEFLVAEPGSVCQLDDCR